MLQKPAINMPCDLHNKYSARCDWEKEISDNQDLYVLTLHSVK